MSSPAPSIFSATQASDNGDEKSMPSKKGFKFWLILASMCACVSLAALEIASVPTALPTISNSLNAYQFTWFGSAYGLASTAFVPISGGMARMFGRRTAALVNITLFALGSGLSGCANSMNMLIAGRIIQGLGGGGIQSLTGIVLADILTLQESGLYTGLYGLTWGLAASIGPVIGGSLASQGQWRWLFYLNIPIALVSGVAVAFFLDLPTPPGTYKEKFLQIDWIGNFLIVASTIAYTLGLTWGGITVPWSSPAVLVPLAVGVVGLVAFLVYEAVFAEHPLVPFAFLTNLTSINGYIQSFCSMVTTLAIVYYLPVYFQACKGASPVASGTYLLSFASFAPAIIITVVSVKATGRYRPQTWIGWILTIVGLCLLSTIETTDRLEKSLGYLALLGAGIGVLNATPMYSIQAPLPEVKHNAPAITFMWFLRSFASVWGVTVGGSILRNQLAERLTPLIDTVPLYTLIPKLFLLPPHILFRVQVAFAASLASVWRVLAIINTVGFLMSLFMKGIPLRKTLDDDWVSKKETQSFQSTPEDNV